MWKKKYGKQEVVKKSAEGCQAPRTGRLDAVAIQGLRSSLVSPGTVAAFELVRQERGARPECAAPALPRHRAEPTPVWLPAGAGDAQTGGLSG